MIEEFQIIPMQNISIIIIICVHIIWLRKKHEKKARKLNQLQFSAPDSTAIYVCNSCFLSRVTPWKLNVKAIEITLLLITIIMYSSYLTIVSVLPCMLLDEPTKSALR